jgi:hypothetical protein
MAYIVLTLTGWFSIQIAKIEWPTAKQVLFISVVLLVRLVGYLAVEFLVPMDDQGIPTQSVVHNRLEAH